MALVFSRRLAELLRKVEPFSPVAQALLDPQTNTTSFGNFLDVRGGKLFSYSPANRDLGYTVRGQWSRDGRQAGKPARIARKFLADPTQAALSDKDFEGFANLILGSGTRRDGRFRLVAGEDVRRWYHEDSYSPKAGGTLANSCMRYRKCQGYLDIYVANPNQVRLLVLVNHRDELLGRALVWETDQGTAMDRAYGSDATQAAFTQYAKEEGWLQPYRKGAPTLTVQLDQSLFPRYPYMDTFAFLKPADNTLRNLSSLGTYQLQDTHGGPQIPAAAAIAPLFVATGGDVDDDGSYHTQCNHCDNDYDPEEEGYNGYCEYCADEFYPICFNCGDREHQDNAMYGSDDNAYCHSCWSDRFLDCDTCGETVRRGERHADDDLCENCWEARFTVCVDCDETVELDDVRDDLCPSCWAATFAECEGCGNVLDLTDRLAETKRCDRCHAEAEDADAEEGVVVGDLLLIPA